MAGGGPVGPPADDELKLILHEAGSVVMNRLRPQIETRAWFSAAGMGEVAGPSPGALVDSCSEIHTFLCRAQTTAGTPDVKLSLRVEAYEGGLLFLACAALPRCCWHGAVNAGKAVRANSSDCAA